MTRGGARGRSMDPAMTRMRIDDDGGSKSDLGEGKEDGGGSRSGCCGWMGEAQARPSMKMVREVRGARGDDDRAATVRWLSGEEDEVMEGKNRGGDIYEGPLVPGEATAQD